MFFNEIMEENDLEILVKNQEEIYFENEKKIFKEVIPLRKNNKLNDYNLIYIIRELYLEISDLDEIAISEINKTNPNFLSKEKLDRINDLLFFFNKKQEKVNSLRDVYDLKIKSFESIVDSLKTYEGLKKVKISSNLNDSNNHLFEIIRRYPHKMAYVSSNKKMRFNQKVKINLFYGDTEKDNGFQIENPEEGKQFFMTFEKYSDLIKNQLSKNHLSFNLIPYKAAIAISFFDKFKFNEHTELITGKTDVVEMGDYIEQILLVNSLEDLKFGRRFLAKKDSEIKEYLNNDFLKEEFFFARDTINNSNPMLMSNYSGGNYSPKTTIENIRTFVAEETLKLSSILKQLYENTKV